MARELGGSIRVNSYYGVSVLLTAYSHDRVIRGVSLVLLSLGCRLFHKHLLSNAIKLLFIIYMLKEIMSTN